MDGTSNHQEMEHRVLAAFLRLAFVVSLLYGCYIFHTQGDPSLGALINFVPAAVIFLADVAHTVASHFLAAGGSAFLGSIDQITAFCLLMVAVLVLIGVFVEGQRSERAFDYASFFTTFVVGYEAGKQMSTRRRRAAERSRQERKR